MIEASQEQGVLILGFNRPRKKNAIGNASYRALVGYLTEAQRNESIKAVLIKGLEGIFCAGNDLDEFIGHPPQGPEAPAFRFITTLMDFPKPLVAAVDGPAVGVGATLLLHCDLVYASPQAHLIFPFVELGVVPEACSTLLLPARLGYLNAFELLTLSNGLQAKLAEEKGLVNQVIQDQPVNNFALQQAKLLAQLPNDALCTTKRLMKQNADTRSTNLQESKEFARLINSPDVIANLKKMTGRN